MRKGRLSAIERWRSGVEDADLGGFDLVVAMHPDEATEPAVRAALAHDIDFAIVPCCVFPLDGVKRSRGEWLDYLMSLAPGIRTAELPITGANVILWRKRGEQATAGRGAERSIWEGTRRGQPLHLLEMPSRALPNIR